MSMTVLVPSQQSSSGTGSSRVLLADTTRHTITSRIAFAAGDAKSLLLTSSPTPAPSSHDININKENINIIHRRVLVGPASGTGTNSNSNIQERGGGEGEQELLDGLQLARTGSVTSVYSTYYSPCSKATSKASRSGPGLQTSPLMSGCLQGILTAWNYVCCLHDLQTARPRDHNHIN